MVVTGGQNGRRHGDGWRRQAASATMLDCSGDSNEVWEIRMWREVRLSIVKLSYFAFYPSDIDQTSILQDGRHTIIANSVFYKGTIDKFANY